MYTENVRFLDSLGSNRNLFSETIRFFDISPEDSIEIIIVSPKVLDTVMSLAALWLIPIFPNVSSVGESSNPEFLPKINLAGMVFLSNGIVPTTKKEVIIIETIIAMIILFSTFFYKSF